MIMNDNTDSLPAKLDEGRPALLKLLQQGSVDTADVMALRRGVFRDRSLSRIEVEDLFGLDAVVRPDSDAWAEFLVEAVTDHVVWDQRPTGVLGEEQARWLIDKVDATRSAAAFAVLVNVLEEADRMPRWFASAVRRRAVAGWPAVTPLIAAGDSARAA